MNKRSFPARPIAEVTTVTTSCVSDAPAPEEPSPLRRIALASRAPALLAFARMLVALPVQPRAWQPRT